MSRSRVVSGLAATILAWERRHGADALRRGMPIMLAGWIGYFLLVNAFVRSLERIAIPLVGLTLDKVLVAQGTFAIFVIALMLLRGGADRRRNGER